MRDRYVLWGSSILQPRIFFPKEDNVVTTIINHRNLLLSLFNIHCQEIKLFNDILQRCMRLIRLDHSNVTALLGVNSIGLYYLKITIQI